MGIGYSKEVPKKRNATYYRPPEVRQKDRYDPVEKSTFTSQHDASIDKVRNPIPSTPQELPRTL